MADPFRGLHIGPKEVERFLAREPGAPVLQPEADEQGESGFEAWSNVEARLAFTVHFPFRSEGDRRASGGASGRRRHRWGRTWI